MGLRFFANALSVISSRISHADKGRSRSTGQANRRLLAYEYPLHTHFALAPR